MSDLHDLMTAVDLPPGRVDIGRAVADGRRRSRRRAVLGAGAAVLVVAGSFTAVQQVARRSVPVPVPIPAASPPASPAPPPGCTVETYAQSGTVEAVDESGQYLVGTAPNPVLWKDGKPTPLAGATGTPTAVNGSGVVVGYDSNDQDQFRGWVWRDGHLTRLGKATGYKWTMPTAINAQGDIVGYALGDALDVSIPVLWRADRRRGGAGAAVAGQQRRLRQRRPGPPRVRRLLRQGRRRDRAVGSDHRDDGVVGVGLRRHAERHGRRLGGHLGRAGRPAGADQPGRSADPADPARRRGRDDE